MLAETQGNDANIVMAGAHLDSVQEGPGINDNGSGSAALLETAIQMAKVKPTNTVRFAWWGAEEAGPARVRALRRRPDREEADDIALYLNFDMVARRTTCSASTTATIPATPHPLDSSRPGSAEIEDIFEKFYAAGGEPFQDSEFSGRSDYGPFIAVGIPAGGLFTGAEGPRPRPRPPCTAASPARLRPVLPRVLRQPRGDGQNTAHLQRASRGIRLVGNINIHALDVNSDAVATSILTFAYDTSKVNAVAGKPGKSNGLYKNTLKR